MVSPGRCVGGQSADEWNYFAPVRVTKLSCRTERVRHDAAGIDPTREELVWQAEAFAERRDEPGWSKIVAIFPSNLKGRHAAEKACSQWMDEATKCVQRAAPALQP